MSSAPLISTLRAVGAQSGGRGWGRPDRARDDSRRLVLRHQRLDERIVLDHALGLGLAAIALGSVPRRRGVGDRAGFDLDALGAPIGLLRQRRLKTLAQRRR